MTLGVGLIGCGFVGFRHATALQAIAEHTDVPARLVAVCDSSSERADVFGTTFGTEALTDHRQLLERPDVDAVYVCTPTDTHLELVSDVVSTGRAIFCEKPLGRDLEEAQRVAKVVEAAAVPNQVGLVLRSSVLYLALRSFLADLGEPVAVVFRDDQAWPIEAHYGSVWRRIPAVAGGGTLLEHSIHDVDLIRWLFGEPDEISAGIRYHAGIEGVEDAAVALMEIDGGPVVTLTSVWHRISARRSERWLEVLGVEGRARAEGDFSGTLEVQTEGSDAVVLGQEGVLGRAADHFGFPEDERRLAALMPLEDLWFVRAVVAGRPPAPSIADGLAAHRLVDRIYRAAERRRYS